MRSFATGLIVLLSGAVIALLFVVASQLKRPASPHQTPPRPGTLQDGTPWTENTPPESAQSKSSDEVVSTEVHPPSKPTTTHHDFRGTLFLPHLKPAGDKELQLLSRGEERPVWTDEEGNFSFVVLGESFPISLQMEQGPLLYQRQEAPGGAVELNLHLLAPVHENGGLLTPNAVSAERTPEGAYHLQVFGRSLLREGSQVIVRLKGSKKTLAANLRPLDRSGLLGEIKTTQPHFFSGSYDLVTAWKILSADPAEQAEVRHLLDNPGQIEVSVTRPIYLGRREEEREQEQEIQSFYRLALAECQASRDLMLLSGSRIRGKVNKKLNASPERQAQARRHPACPISLNLGRGRKANIKAWRKLIDIDLPQYWEPYRDRDSIPFPGKYPLAANTLPLLFAQLKIFSHLESRLVYQAAGRSPDPRDYVDFESGPAMERRQVMARIDTFIESIQDSLSQKGSSESRSLFQRN